MPGLNGCTIGGDGQSHGLGFGDINNDGREDLLTGHDYGLFWRESTGLKNGKFTWNERLIDKPYSQPHALHLADLTGDEEELISGKRVRAHNGKNPGGNEPPCIHYYEWNKDKKPIRETQSMRGA